MSLDPGLANYGNKRGKKKRKKKGKSKGGIWNAVGSVMDAFNPSRTAGSLSEAIEKQAAAQKRQAERKAADNASPDFGGDPFQSLQDQLFGAMNSLEVAPTPLETLRKMASQQVGSQYDPMISALAGQMETKKTRGGRSQKEARAMYGDLAKDTLAALPQMTQQFAAEDKATNARYDEAQGVLNEQYGKQSADQDAVLRRLGVQAAAPEASQQASDDQKYFQSQMELDQQQARTAEDTEQNASLQYQRDMGGNARMAGENTAQDIRQQLEDYLTEAGGQMGSLKAQRSSALSALIAQMQQQDQERVQETRQSEMDNIMDMFRFQLDATNSQQQNQARMMKAAEAAGGMGGSNSPFKGTSGLSGASNFLASQYPDQPILASNLMEQINDVLSNKNVVNGKHAMDQGDASLGKGPTYTRNTQEYMMDLLRREFEKEGNRYNNQDINSTMNALLAYMGKLR